MFTVRKRTRSQIEIIKIYIRFFKIKKKKGLFLPIFDAVFLEYICVGIIGIAVDQRKAIQGALSLSILSASEMMSMSEITL